MLVQVVALLSLGVLCSSAPTPTTESQRQNWFSSIIRETIEDVMQLNSNEVPTVIPTNAMMERCMQSYLKNFTEILAVHNKSSKITEKMKLINSFKDIIPKDLNKECNIERKASPKFQDKLETFLKLLFQTSLNASRDQPHQSPEEMKNPNSTPTKM